MKNWQMNSGFGKCATSMLAGVLLAVTAQADTKLAIIDLKKVFDGYFKTKLADTQLKERATDAEKVMKGMVDDYQKANEDYKKLIESSNDQAVSSDERDKRKKSAETKLLELQEIDKNVMQFRRQTQSTLDEQKRRMRDNILKEIREIVNAKAKGGSFTAVVDTAAESVNQTPIILYSNGENDLTDGVLTALNEKAPPGSLDSKEKESNALDLPVKSSAEPKDKKK